MLSSHVSDGLFINTEFWVANGEDLEQKFKASANGARDRKKNGGVLREGSAVKYAGLTRSAVTIRC